MKMKFKKTANKTNKQALLHSNCKCEIWPNLKRNKLNETYFRTAVQFQRLD